MTHACAYIYIYIYLRSREIPSLLFNLRAYVNTVHFISFHRPSCFPIASQFFDFVKTAGDNDNNLNSFAPVFITEWLGSVRPNFISFRFFLFFFFFCLIVTGEQNLEPSFLNLQRENLNFQIYFQSNSWLNNKNSNNWQPSVLFLFKHNLITV